MSERKEVPSTACRFAGGAVEFAKEADADGRIPITMMARSAEPIEHPWWGRVVHDMAGMQLHKKVLPADYEHGDPIGLLNEFEATDKGLIVKGLLVPTGESRDLVPHLTKQSQGGVPYEASINFFGDGIKVEWLGEDQVAQVNGYTFEGPGCIIREWPLRGVAVCPYGADMYTESKFSGARAESISIHNFKELDMSKPAKLSGAAATEEKPAEATATTETKPTEEVKSAEGSAPATTETAASPTPTTSSTELSADRQEAKRFKDAFGDAGVLMYFEGLTFDQATSKHNEKKDAAAKQLSEKVTALEKENDELKKKLGAAGQFGEATPVETGTSDAKTRAGFSGKVRIQGREKKQ